MKAQGWTVNALSYELQMDRRRIGKIVRNIEPVSDDGRWKRYRMEDVVAAIIASIKPVNSDRARLMKARVSMAEHKNRQMAKNLIPAEDIEKGWDALVKLSRQIMLAVPGQIAPQLAKEKDVSICSDIIQTAVHAALTELSETRVENTPPEGTNERT